MSSSQTNMLPIQSVPVDGLSAVAAGVGYGPALTPSHSPRSNPMHMGAAFLTDGTTTGAIDPLSAGDPRAAADWQNINQLLHNSMDMDVEVNYNQLNQAVTNIQNNHTTMIGLYYNQNSNVDRLEAAADRMACRFQAEVQQARQECQVWYNNAQMGHLQAEVYAAATTHLGIRATQELEDRDRRAFEYEEVANFQGRVAWHWESQAHQTYTEASEDC